MEPSAFNILWIMGLVLLSIFPKWAISPPLGPQAVKSLLSPFTNSPHGSSFFKKKKKKGKKHTSNFSQNIGSVVYVYRRYTEFESIFYWQHIITLVLPFFGYFIYNVLSKSKAHTVTVLKDEAEMSLLRSLNVITTWHREFFVQHFTDFSTVIIKMTVP